MDKAPDHNPELSPQGGGKPDPDSTRHLSEEELRKLAETVAGDDEEKTRPVADLKSTEEIPSDHGVEDAQDALPPFAAESQQMTEHVPFEGGAAGDRSVLDGIDAGTGGISMGAPGEGQRAEEIPSDEVVEDVEGSLPFFAAESQHMTEEVPFGGGGPGDRSVLDGIDADGTGTEEVPTDVSRPSSTDEVPTINSPQGGPTDQVGTEEVPLVLADDDSDMGMMRSPAGATEEIAMERGAGLKGSTASPGAGAEEEDDFLVLLPEDKRSEMDTQTIDADEESGSIAEAGLQTRNPLADTEEVDDYGSTGIPGLAGSGAGLDDNVGVIDEIAELASSLDQDILSAEETDEVEAEYEEDSYEPFEFDDAFDEPRGSKMKFLVTVAGIAAVVLLGVFLAPSLMKKFRPGTDVATASGGVEPGGTTTGVDGVDGGPAPELSAVRLAVREKVELTMDLGLQWRDE